MLADIFYLTNFLSAFQNHSFSGLFCLLKQPAILKNAESSNFSQVLLPYPDLHVIG